MPSDVGNFNPLIVTEPELLPVNSRSAFEAFVDMVLSVTVTPSNVDAPVTPSVVDTVAAPVTASVLPSNVKFASPCIALAPVTVVIVLFVDPVFLDVGVDSRVFQLHLYRFSDAISLKEIR